MILSSKQALQHVLSISIVSSEDLSATNCLQPYAESKSIWKSHLTLQQAQMNEFPIEFAYKLTIKKA